MPNKIQVKVDVTQADIDMGRTAFRNPKGIRAQICPISIAAVRAFGYFVAVGYNSMTVETPKGRRNYNLPEIARDFTRQFDSSKPIVRDAACPFSFVVRCSPSSVKTKVEEQLCTA